MKKIMPVLLILCLTFPIFAQEIMTVIDSTSKEFYPLSKEELKTLAVKVDSLQQANEIKDELIGQFKIQIENYETLVITDSLILSYKDRQIKTLNEINKLQKPKWWEKYEKWAYYIFGAGSIILGSWVASNVVGG